MNKSELICLIRMTSISTSAIFNSASAYYIENQLTPSHTQISALIILKIFLNSSKAMPIIKLSLKLKKLFE